MPRRMSQNCFSHPNCPKIGLYIVDSDERAAFCHTIDGCSKGSLFPLIGREIEGQSDDRFSGGSEKNRVSEFLQTVKMPDDGKIHLIIFAEADSRVQDDLTAVDSGFFGKTDGFSQVI